ncbi:cobyric acid synthase [Spiractinospora alimapuensis]|uniref:cobyric acid synthase n=1 Tax=Spiractinospora alimapuensis TaxID=2820884 RepID=UPI001EEBCC49|nr:cobyric acid synthase [Spiractinospora alimapuensis]QVQ51883.1 cobyric acid synthase [Spiractinospora alimapuensis]
MWNESNQNGTHGALLVAGTTSDAGKSAVVAGLCRWLRRRGVKVAPFKAQNMSLNSVVTPDGAEIGRAQAMQAAACEIEPTAAMNPVLLKPGSDRSSQVVVRGRAIGEADATTYHDYRARLRDVAVESLAELRRDHEVVICEGAGSPAEINLRAGDIANMGLARAAGLPTVVVGDIDRGGVFAALYGTQALLDPEDQAHIAGYIINKFRGAPELLAPGLDMLRGHTGRPVLGVLPWLNGLWLDAEDSLALSADRGPTQPPAGAESLRVAVVRLPRISNFTDIDALSVEPGVDVRFVTAPHELDGADLVVLPGTRATVADLDWLHERGLAAALRRRAAERRPILGICGGYQMLARHIDDTVESRRGGRDGLALLPTTVAFQHEKILGRPLGSAYDHPVRGYEIHHGLTTVHDAPGTDSEPFLDGCRQGAVFGTTWHGALENDAFRRAFLTDVAGRATRSFVPAPTTDFAAARAARLDALGDLVEHNLDTDAVWRLIEQGAPSGLPTIGPHA